MSKFVIILTDLDGTMVSHVDYSYGDLKQILRDLKAERTQYIVIPCTSKTELEVLQFGKDIGLNGPYIVENGGKIIPADRGLFSTFRDQFSVPFSQIKKLLDSFPSHIRKSIKCLHEMSVTDIAQMTGLGDIDAANAKNRKHSLVFGLVKEDDVLMEIEDLLKNTNYKITRGGRFFHMISRRDKAKAAQELIEWGLNKGLDGNFEVWSFGDASNDLSLLKMADKSAIITNVMVSQQHLISSLPRAYVSKKGAPAGWRESLEVFKSSV